MDSILSILTKDEKDFISHHGIEPSDIFDGRGEIIRVYHAKAKEKACRYVVANPCPYGHRLKDRHGHCLVCNPALISFTKRESDKGVVYIAYSGKYTKVGMIGGLANRKVLAVGKKRR